MNRACESAICEQSRQVHFGVGLMVRLRAKLAVRIAALGAATLGLSACYYDAGVGLGYYDDGYGCDPYGAFDSYYDCDYRGGFYNIGYGGGWYQDYWYPGYGFYIFDRGGRRYQMHDYHRRYWAGKRHEWYRGHHRGDSQDGRRRWNGRRTYNSADSTDQPDNRRQDRRRDDYRSDGRQGDGSRGDGRGERRRNWSSQGSDAVQAVPPLATPQAPPPAGRGDGRGWRRGNDGSAPRMDRGNRRGWQAAPPSPQSPQGTQSPAPAAQPRMARPGRDQQRTPRDAERGNPHEK